MYTQFAYATLQRKNADGATAKMDCVRTL